MCIRDRNYTYELTLEGAQYDLIDVQYHLPEDCYGDTFYSDLGGHLEVLMWNISRVYPGLWKLGNYPKDTEYTNFTATEKNCLAALQEMCIRDRRITERTRKRGTEQCRQIQRIRLFSPRREGSRRIIS